MAWHGSQKVTNTLTSGPSFQKHLNSSLGMPHFSPFQHHPASTWRGRWPPVKSLIIHMDGRNLLPFLQQAHLLVQMALSLWKSHNALPYEKKKKSLSILSNKHKQCQACAKVRPFNYNTKILKSALRLTSICRSFLPKFHIIKKNESQIYFVF